jgi:hypothetical protein
MNLYIDEDSVDPLLARLLRRAGHDVQEPADVGLLGSHDAVALRHAVREKRAFLSCNYRDFEPIHFLIMETGGHHPGILMVRKDNNRKRDLTPAGVVRAITRYLAAGGLLIDQYVVLNQWR